MRIGRISLRLLVAILISILAGAHLATALPQGGWLPNEGQWDQAVLHAGAWNGIRVIVLDDGLLIDRAVDESRQVVKLLLPPVRSACELDSPTGLLVNIYRGSDPAGWANRLAQQSTLRHGDLEFRMTAEGLHYRRPPLAGSFRFEGGELAVREETDREGVLLWPGGMTETAPVRDASDQLLWSTLFGGNSSDSIREAQELAGGDLILYGDTYSPDLPTSPGAYDEVHNDSSDLFFARLSAAGDDLIWCTYVGGSDRDHSDAFTMADDAIYFTGTVMSDDLPVPGALDTSYGGSFDIYLGKLSSDGGTLHWASYLGGSGNDQTNAILVDGEGRVVVTGFSDTPDYPTTPGAFQAASAGNDDIIVTSLAADGSAIQWSTFIGGSGDQSAMDMSWAADGDLLLTGTSKGQGFPVTPGAYDTDIPSGNYVGEVVVVKLAPDGSALRWASYLGGSTDNMEAGLGIAEDAFGNVIVAGRTESEDFPTTPGAFDTVHGGGGDSDIFVTKFNPQGSDLVWSTFVGGADSDGCSGLEITPDGWLLLVGYTFSQDFPVTPGAYDESINSQPTDGADAYLALLSGAGDEMLWASYFGGITDDRGYGISLTADGNMIVTGNTQSGNFPTTPGAYMEEFATSSMHGFVAKFMLNGLLTGTGGIPPARDLNLAAHPNPFNPAVTIDFELDEAGPLSLRIYDVSGREVAKLFDGVHPGGRSEIVWRPEGLASGLYLVQMETSRGGTGERLVLLK